jgi:ribosomal-protein-alanine acetyltransferase
VEQAKEFTSKLSAADLVAMTADHLDEVVALNARVETFPWTSQGWSTCLSPNYQNWLVLNPGPIAYSSFLITQEYAELLNLGVDPQYQSKGLGRALLQCALNLLPQSVQNVYLEVRESNGVARLLYESLGFKIMLSRPEYYPAGNNARENALVYRRSCVKDSLVESSLG